MPSCPLGSVADVKLSSCPSASQRSTPHSLNGSWGVGCAGLWENQWAGLSSSTPQENLRKGLVGKCRLGNTRLGKVKLVS